MWARRSSATPANLGSFGGQPAGELPQHALDADHRGRPQRQPGLGDVVEQGRGEHVARRRPRLRPAPPTGCGVPAGRRVEHPGVEQHRVGTEQRTRSGASRRVRRAGAQRIAAMSAARPALNAVGGDLVRGQPSQHSHFDQGGPLQPTDPWAEAELGGGGGEPRGTPGGGGPRSRPGRAGRAPGSPGWVGSRPVTISQPTTRRSLSGVAHCSASGSSCPAVDTDPGAEHAGHGEVTGCAANIPAATRSAR